MGLIRRSLLGMALLTACGSSHPPPPLDGDHTDASEERTHILSATAHEPKQEIVSVVTCLPLDDDFVVEPGYRCELRPGGVNVRDCEFDAQCMSSADCTEKPLGNCAGVSSSQCTYPFELETPCTTDEDCTALAEGMCFMTPLIDTLCFPSGECKESSHGSCHYQAQNVACESDVDCTAAPGGTCRRVIEHTWCVYDECRDDGDCGPRQACSCVQDGKRCVAAQCHANSDCGTGEACLGSGPCGDDSDGPSYCTTPDDTCHSDDDCTGRDGFLCDYDHLELRWACQFPICNSD